MKVLFVNNLSIGHDKKVVKRNINFSVDAGDFVCIIGSNGTGKTTLMKTILGIEKIINGEVVYEKGVTKKDITYLSQNINISKDFPATVEEVVCSGLINSKNSKKEAKEQMLKLGVYEYKEKSFNELSGGQRQRVLIARALCSSGKIIFLDEPTTGLDSNITKELYSIIEKLNKEDKSTIIMITHDMKMVKKLATKVVKIDE